MFAVSCDEVVRRLEVYCDREVSWWTRRRIERHLSRCEGCLRRHEFRRAIQAVVRRKCGEAEVPPTLAERLRAALRDERRA